VKLFIWISIFSSLVIYSDNSFAVEQTMTTKAGLLPTRLRCEYRIDPLGIDCTNPRLDWILQTNDPSARKLGQIAYQVLAASSPERLAKDDGDLWDSGKVSSDRMSQNPFAGKTLVSHQTVWWKVRVWSEGNAPSLWSNVAQWTMGVLKAEDWNGAQWLGAPDDGTQPDLTGPRKTYETILLRRQFTVKPNLKRALVHVCGLGQYEMTVNGSKVTKDVLTPGWSQYEETCLYDTYDITSLLHTGNNAEGLFLGNGMYLVHEGVRFAGNTRMTWAYRPIKAVALIRLEYADGTVENVVTDEQWRCRSGPITFSSIYGGEDYDARLEPDGWDQPAFQDRTWAKPQVLEGPGGRLKGLSCSAPPIRTFEKFAPVHSTEIKPGVTVYDLGQNAALMLHMKVAGTPGSMVRVIPGELLAKDGSVDKHIFMEKDVWWQYTLKGHGDEDYFSKFFYVGARYLQVELIPASRNSALPNVELLEGAVIRADANPVGQFACSNDLFNRIFMLVRWAQQNNMVSVMTDCPTREKRGWLEEDHLNGPALRYNWDMATLFSKTANDMRDAQRADGLVPTTVPHYSHWNRPFADSPEWSSACVLVPWQQYQFEGDIEILARSYPMMKRYLDFLNHESKDNLITYGLGDWMEIKPRGTTQPLTPIALSATAFYHEDASLLSSIATILDKPAEAISFAKQDDVIRESFNNTFFDSTTNNYGSEGSLGSQCSNSMALVMGLAKTPNDQALLANIVSDVQAHGLTAGDVGYRYLLRALAHGGRSDVIYALNNQSDKPGYGYQLKLGKTSLTESWDGGQSQNHFMLGQIIEWFYHDLAGIQPDPEGPGFKKFIIKPAIVGDLTWVQASYDSISGRIVSEWQRKGKTLELHIIIPVNTTAIVFVPTLDSQFVKEGGHPTDMRDGITFLRMEGSYAVYGVGSGDYTFQSKEIPMQ